MIEIEKKISPLIESLFPAFYREEGQRFIAFVKAYYEWLEQSSYLVNGQEVAPKTLHYSRSLFDIKDIDKTPDEFLSYFKEKFLRGVSITSDTDTRNLVKHSLELYRSKGSQKSIELLFSLLFGEDVQIYLPSKDILRASDGEWFRPEYIELEINEKTKAFVGQQITGASSGSTALVEGFARRNVRGKIIDVLFLSSISGNFIVGELVGSDGVAEDDPKIIGSLSNIIINASGRNFSVGDVVNINSDIAGIEGKARVARVGSATGRVDYRLIDGGTGYSANADVIISEKVLSTSSFNSVNTFFTAFSQQELIEQPLANVEILSPQGDLLNPNNLILGVNSTPAPVVAGYVYNGNTTAATKFLSISVHEVSNVAIGTITNATGTGSFAVGETVTQISPLTGANSFIGTVVTANTSRTLLDITIGDLTSGRLLLGNQSNCSANVTSSILINGTFNDADDIETAGNSAVGNCIIDVVSDETATARAIGSNSSTLGVYEIQNNFRAPVAFTKAYVKNSSKTKASNIFSVSTGNPGGFDIGAIVDTENVFINSDFIGGNNISNVPYLTIPLSGQGSNVGFVDSVTVNNGGIGFVNTDLVIFSGGSPTVNASGTVATFANGTIANITITVPGSGYDSAPTLSIVQLDGVTPSSGSGANVAVNMDFGYGFPKLADGDLTTIINLVLTRFSTTIGTIASLTGINPGSNNNASPYVLVIERSIAGFGRKNFTLTLNGVTRPFLVGEEITQNINEPAVTLEINDVSGDFNIRETLEQTRSDGNVVFGELISSNVSSNTGTFLVRVANSANTFDTSNTILGLETFETANVTNVIANTVFTLGKGEIISTTNVESNTATLFVKRKRFSVSFTSNTPISGASSGAQGNVVAISEISNSPVFGNNAVISSVTGVANGTIEEVEIIDSGFAYRENELITLSEPTNEFVASGFVRLERQGQSEGAFQSTRGFLNSNKFLQDSVFYQEYSYEVQAGISLDKYSQVLRELVHVAGTELFGSVYKASQANLETKIVETTFFTNIFGDLEILSGTSDLMTLVGSLDLQQSEIIEGDLEALSGISDLITLVDTLDLEL